MDHRSGALLEVTLVFIVIQLMTMVLYVVLFHFNLLGDQVLSLAGYMAYAAFILALLAVTGRELSSYGISLRAIHVDTRIIAICIFPVSFLVLLNLVPYPYPHIGQPWSILLILAANVLVLFTVAILLKSLTLKDNKFAVCSLTLATLCMLGLSRIVFQPMQPIDSTMELAQTSLYYLVVIFIFVAPVEELVFRGYVQSRLNEAFGRPYGFFGISWGAGLIIASALFGLMHATGAHFNPLMGSYDLDWARGLVMFFTGLTFGIIREKSGSIAAPAILHGTIDFFSMILVY